MTRIARLRMTLWVACLSLLFMGCGSSTPEAVVAEVDPKIQRIVSLAPSVTETLFALGLGENVVGVTNFCRYPEKAQGIDKIGGYYNPNYEAIYSLKPDLVVHLTEHKREKTMLAELPLERLELDNTSVEGIMAGIQNVGTTCGVTDQSARLIKELEQRIDRVKSGITDSEKPRVLITIGRNMGNAGLKDVYAVGQGSLYSELLDMAGGINVITNSDRAYPILSAESILRLNPDVIIDLVPDLERLGLEAGDVRKEWLELGAKVSAVKEGRVHVFSEKYVTVPGPRFVNLLEDLARTLHPPGDT